VGQVRGFSDLQKYLAGNKEIYKGVILDTNILVTATYEIKKDNEQVEEFLELLAEEEFRLFATVTTRSELLEFHRRLIMTERLLDLVDGSSQIKITKAAKAAIDSQKATMKGRVAKYGSDPVFNDREIKEIKKAFSAGPHSGHQGWLKLCETFFGDYLSKIDSELIERGIEYLSPNEPAMKDLFLNKPEWEGAIKTASHSALGLSDSMILNSMAASKIPFAVSLDFDFGYAVLSDSKMKDVFMPDSIKAEYRHFHFPSL